MEVAAGDDEVLEDLGFFFEGQLAGCRGGGEVFGSFSGGG